MRIDNTSTSRLMKATATMALWATLATSAFAQIPSSMTESDPAPAADAAASTAPAATSNNRGWYVGIGGGVGKLDDSDNRATRTDGTDGQNGEPFVDLLELGVVSFQPDGVLGSVLGPTPLGLLITALKDNVGDPLAGVLCGPLSILLCGADTGTGPQPGDVTSFTSSYKTGTAADLTFGYAFANGFRPEANLAYRTNDFESANFTALGTSTTSQGKAQAISAFGNIWYDFSRDSRLKPYIGGGIGASQVKFKNVSFGSGTTASINGDDTVLAYQLGAGLGYSILDGGADISLDYRYLVANKPEIKVSANNALETEYNNQSLQLSLRFFLGGGKPAKCPDTPAGVAVDAEGCPLDSDGDGIPDYLDKCPGTQAGAQVGPDGCPLDSDGDGVADYLDQCPGTPAGVAVDDKGCPLDSDGDGVPDYLDKCPNTPAGTLVDADGCPAADQDGDGIPDYLDKCPNTPKGIPVGKDGCPLDSDGDGIPDYLDECPNSPAGAKVLPNGCAPVGDCRRPRPGEEVDANGCAVEKKFILRGVKFEFDSDRLTAEAKVILDGVASTLNNYAEISVELAGHTDNVGSDAYNLGLSERRSNSVKNYLTGKGVTATRMTPVGYGLTQPIASNDTEEGREENRRVELKVIE